MMGLAPDSYEAYCLDEAVIYFGLSLTNQLESVGHKPGKEERRAQAERDKLIAEVFGMVKAKSSGFADPAVMFQ